jgi:hypothetical protein
MHCKAVVLQKRNGAWSYVISQGAFHLQTTRNHQARVEGIKLTPEQGTTVAQALINVNEALMTGEVQPEVQQQVEDAIAIMEEVANIQEGPDAKKGPPAPAKPPM